MQRALGESPSSVICNLRRTEALRDAIRSGAISQDLPVRFLINFAQRFFEWFDPDSDEAGTVFITAEQFLDRLTTVCGGSFHAMAKMLFQITDLDDNNSISGEEMGDFFQGFSKFFLVHCSSNCLRSWNCWARKRRSTCLGTVSRG